MNLKEGLQKAWQGLLDAAAPKLEGPDLKGEFENVTYRVTSPAVKGTYRLEPTTETQDITYNILINEAAKKQMQADPAPPDLPGNLRYRYLRTHGGLPIDGPDGRPAMLLEHSDGSRIIVHSDDGRNGTKQIYKRNGVPDGAPQSCEF